MRTLVNLLRVQYYRLLSPISELRWRLLGIVRVRLGSLEVHVDHVGLE